MAERIGYDVHRTSSGDGGRSGGRSLRRHRKYLATARPAVEESLVTCACCETRFSSLTGVMSHRGPLCGSCHTAHALDRADVPVAVGWTGPTLALVAVAAIQHALFSVWSLGPAGLGHPVIQSTVVQGGIGLMAALAVAEGIKAIRLGTHLADLMPSRHRLAVQGSGWLAVLMGTGALALAPVLAMAGILF